VRSSDFQAIRLNQLLVWNLGKLPQADQLTL